MRIGFSFFSKNKTILGVMVEMGMEMEEERRGLPVMQPTVQITFGYVFGYVKFIFNYGRSLSLLDMLKSGAVVKKGTISKGEIESVEDLSIEEALEELKDKHNKN